MHRTRTSMTTRAVRGVATAIGLGLIACSPQPPAGRQEAPLLDADAEKIGRSVTDYFSKTVNLPPELTMTAKDIAPAGVPGMLKGAIQVSDGENTQDVPFLVSRDGRYFVRGEFSDLTVDPLKETMAKIKMKDEPVRGPAEAPVTIVEYSDFQCPYCKRAYDTLEQEVLKEYGGKVKLVFKHLPLTAIHPWAESAAMAAECAAAQSAEGFWKMYDGLFQGQEEITEESLKEKVVEIGTAADLDTNKLGQCLDGKLTQAAVSADMEEANALGVESTPTFFINGRRLEGAVPFENFKSVIDRELAANTAG